MESWQPIRRFKDKIRNNAGEKACPLWLSAGKPCRCCPACAVSASWWFVRQQDMGSFFTLSVELLQSVLKWLADGAETINYCVSRLRIICVEMCVIYQGLCSDVEAVIQDSQTVGRVLLRILRDKLGRKTTIFHFNGLATDTKIRILISKRIFENYNFGDKDGCKDKTILWEFVSVLQRLGIFFQTDASSVDLETWRISVTDFTYIWCVTSEVQ